MNDQCLKLSALVLILTTVLAPAKGQFNRKKDIPGAVRLDNGLIIKGMCGRSNTISPLLLDQKLELRRIEQQVRTYFVSTRRSAAVVADNQVLPRLKFDIPQRRTGAKPMEYRIGLHNHTPFDADGKSKIEFMTANGLQTIDLAITSLNSQFATVNGMSHRWEFWVSMSQLSDGLLYSSNNQPCLLRKAKGFADSANRLNMAQMLLEAKKFMAAQALIADIAAESPDLSEQCERLIQDWSDAVGQRVIDELSVLIATGKQKAARKYVRQFPEDQLAAVVQVRANAINRQLEEDARRIQNIRLSVGSLLAEIKDPNQYQEAKSIWNELNKQINSNTLPRFAPFELFSLDDSATAESKLALVVTGWILGPENAFDDFIEAVGLMNIRHLLADYLLTTEDQSPERSRLVGSIRQQEGFSIERVAQLLQHLPPVDSIGVSDSPTAKLLTVSASGSAAGALVQLPAEYSPLRQYPMLVAFPRGGQSANETIAWWGPQADRNGYILVTPQLFPKDADYGASAEDHRRFVNLLRKLKAAISVDDDRVFIAGHGIGGEAAMDLASAQPSLFAGVVSLGGRGRRHIQWTAHNSMTMPWYVVIGTLQPNYYTRMEMLLRRLLTRSPITREYPDAVYVRYRERGFESFSEEVTQVFEWMALQRRQVFPAQIEATILRTTDVDWSWLTLKQIPARFACMDQPTSFEARPADTPGAKPGTLSAKITGNFFRLASLPSDGYLRISPQLPEIDLQKPIVLRVGSKSTSIDYEPSVQDLLNDFYQHRDRSRFCYMKVPFQKL